MVELKYPRWWSFAERDTFLPIASKVHISKQLKFKIDRDLYIQARSYSEWPVNGGINRFIDGMRKWFSVDEILDGKYDGIIDIDPRNRIIPTTTMPESSVENSAIEVIEWSGYESLEDMAKDLSKSIPTINRWRRSGIIEKIWDRYHLVSQNKSPE